MAFNHENMVAKNTCFLCRSGHGVPGRLDSAPAETGDGQPVSSAR